MEGLKEVLEITKLTSDESAAYPYRCWRGALLPVQIQCECGGKTTALPIPCPLPDETVQINGKCLRCGRKVSATLVAFR